METPTMLDLNDLNVPFIAATALAVSLAWTIHAFRQTKFHASRRYRALEMPEKTLPVVGNILDIVLNGDRVHDWVLENTVRVQGRPWKFNLLGLHEMIVVTTPDAIEEVMATQFTNFVKGKFQIDILSGIFGRGVVMSDGERWYHQRKTVVKFFSAKVLDLFMRQSIQKNMFRLHDVIEQAINTRERIDLKELFHDFTIDTFVEMSLGVELKSIGATEHHPFNEGLEVASNIVAGRFQRAEFVWKAERFLNIGDEGKLKHHMGIVYAWMHEVIQQSVERSIQAKQSGVASMDKKCKSLIELFLEHSEEDREGLKEEDFVDFILTLVIGARDTTADTLSWLFYALSKHPEVEAKLRDELKRELPSDTSTYLTMEHLKPLVYLEAVIKETLRLYPAGAFIFREAVEDTVISGDILVRKGQHVVMPTYTIGRNPVVWGSDAATFRPERWIDEATGQIKPESPFKFFTFTAGPRICAGINLAMMQLRIVTANLLQRFRFDVDATNDGSYRMGVTLTMKHPLVALPRMVDGG
ncbi:hypothetical protein Poli38472_008239 [Pythium oligandrum]|uniref:Cytochrome P450 n=1 Tax=Pythium oligandrum TaxID=41045 RepID=A0A8K1FN80_PYTOL|nr:hypothetical protein Poli38472_008239 [Pythium oligandrum]|eukprot:TMW65597.1 hypothetical protein Poli38472_008239 [Pythium oligandrum]